MTHSKHFEVFLSPCFHQHQCFGQSISFHIFFILLSTYYSASKDRMSSASDATTAPFLQERTHRAWSRKARLNNSSQILLGLPIQHRQTWWSETGVVPLSAFFLTIFRVTWTNCSLRTQTGLAEEFCPVSVPCELLSVLHPFGRLVAGLTINSYRRKECD